MKKVYIETLGCQMNKSDSERILGMLSHFDYKETEDFKDADLLLINTCSIRQLSADKAFSTLGRWGQLKTKNPNLKIGICGCVAQTEKENVFKRNKNVDFVFGTHNIYELPELIKRVENGERVCAITNTAVKENSDFCIIRDKSFNAWVPIIEGCNNFCTYCIVPYTRGRERSRDFNNIIEEVKTCVKQGFKEITLLGQNVDSYGKDLKDERITLANLLREISKIEGDFRVRFVTSYPTDITDDLIKAVGESDKICKYFHIPMQSGNNTVLKAMNRRYTREQYGEIVKKIRETFKDNCVTITSDFIAGFPGETEEQFYDTLSAIEEFELDYSNTAAYSPRELTVAAKWTDKFIDEQTKKERLKILNDKNKEAVINSNKKCVGKTLNVLVESFKENEDGQIVLNSRAENNKIVHFNGEKNLVGTFQKVKIKDYSTWCLFADMV